MFNMCDRTIDQSVFNKIYLCPSTPKGKCQWEGNASDILVHFQSSHKDLLMTSNTIKEDITQDNEHNRLMAHKKGLLLIQTKQHREKRKLQVHVRFLKREEFHFMNLHYCIEIIYGKYGFTNETPTDIYNPVYNIENGVEIDIQSITLIAREEQPIDFITIIINLHDECDYVNQTHIYENFVPRINQNNCFGTEEYTNFDNCTAANYEEEINTTNKSECELNSKDIKLTDVTDSVEELPIGCANCHCYMVPPIFLCMDGHSVCSRCKQGICNICGQNITDVRNINLETHNKTLKYPCRYKAQGCGTKHNSNEIRQHELYCSYCAYKCEFCPYESKLGDIKTHFRIAHPSTKVHEIMTGLHFPKGSNFAIINESGVFYCTATAAETYIEWKVIYCGPKDRYFSCAVQITGKKHYHQTKTYYLRRVDNEFKWTVPFDELKFANIKEKNALLFIAH